MLALQVRGSAHDRLMALNFAVYATLGGVPVPLSRGATVLLRRPAGLRTECARMCVVNGERLHKVAPP